MNRPHRTRVRGATVVDGTGNPGHVGDVLIEAGRFAVDDGRDVDDTIDAGGLVAAPGFIESTRTRSARWPTS
jgi:N-acyl-D-amino-acid deacylase